MPPAGFSIESLLPIPAMLLALVALSTLLHKRNRKRLYNAYLLILIVAAACRLLMKFTVNPVAGQFQLLLNFLGLVEFIAIYLILNAALSSGKTRKLLAYLLTVVLSTELSSAYWQGYTAVFGWIHSLNALLIFSLACLVVAEEMRKEVIFFYQVPLFWISLASCFYAGIYLLTRFLSPLAESGAYPALPSYQQLALGLAEVLRMLLFALAGFVGMRESKDWGIPEF